MRRVLVAVSLLGLLLVLTASAAAAGDPRDETVRLRPADVALAKRISVRPGDVGAGWVRTPVQTSGGERLTCPGFDPDFSAFTITGRENVAYAQPNGTSIISFVEVYKSARDAIGDFTLGAKPQVARCLGASLQRQLDASAVIATVRSARVVAAPRVGDRRIAYRVIARLEAVGQRVDVYLDVVILQRGRSEVGLMFTSARKPYARRSAISAAVAGRMR